MLILLPALRPVINPVLRILSRDRRIILRGFKRSVASLILIFLLGSPAFAQAGGDRVTSFVSNSMSYAQGLGIFGAGFLVMWAVANIARERPHATFSTTRRDCVMRRVPAAQSLWAGVCRGEKCSPAMGT